MCCNVEIFTQCCHLIILNKINIRESSSDSKILFAFSPKQGCPPCAWWVLLNPLLPLSHHQYFPLEWYKSHPLKELVHSTFLCAGLAWIGGPKDCFHSQGRLSSTSGCYSLLEAFWTWPLLFRNWRGLAAADIGILWRGSCARKPGVCPAIVSRSKHWMLGFPLVLEYKAALKCFWSN